MPQAPIDAFIARWSASAAAQRAEEERNGLVRWLRPEFQNPQGDKTGQRALVEAGGKKAVKGKAAKSQPAAWPKDLPSRIGVVRATIESRRGGLSIDDVALMIGSGQIVVPPRDKGIVLDAKVALRRRPGKLMAEKLCREEPILRSVYLELRERIVHPRPPVMCNTDGDLMEFHTLTYRIDNAEAAFSALAPLAVDIDREELLVDAKKDRGGKLRKVTFPWTRLGNAKRGVLPSTTLAIFTIDGTTLTVSVNSAKRAKAARAEIAKRLPSVPTCLRHRPLSSLV